MNSSNQGPTATPDSEELLSLPCSTYVTQYAIQRLKDGVWGTARKWYDDLDGPLGARERLEFVRHLDRDFYKEGYTFRIAKRVRTDVISPL